MIYNAKTEEIYALTKNCYPDFGIPSTVAYGNNSSKSDFLISSFIPELNDSNNVEEMNSENGLLVTVDIEYLKKVKYKI